ncbi:MAG: DUF1269 domain-containing protein [bacterium]
MSRRLYFVVPTVAIAQQIEKELLLARIDSGRMHFMASEGTDLHDLPEATLAQKSDVVHGLEVGLVAGGGAGVFAGFGAMFFLGVSSSTAAIMGMLAIFGALFGAWISALIGTSVPNSRLETFQKDLQEGHVLMMLDVPKERVHEVTDMVRMHHPDTDFSGVEPTIPAFP